jgi:hypothetical protein
LFFHRQNVFRKEKLDEVFQEIDSSFQDTQPKENKFSHEDVRHCLRVIGLPVLKLRHGERSLFSSKEIQDFVCDIVPDNEIQNNIDTLNSYSKVVRELFQKLDESFDGKLSAVELKDLLRDIVKFEESMTTSNVLIDENVSETVRREDEAIINVTDYDDLELLPEGTFVDVNYQGSGSWYAGIVNRDCGGGKFDIEYGDGVVEKGISREMLRKVNIQNCESYSVGDRVEARLLGRDTWFPGTIIVDYVDYTYDVTYDDGTTEMVRIDLIRRLDNDTRVTIKEDNIVEVMYHPSDPWITGQITHDNGNFTFDVLYDDGREETAVASTLLRVISQSRGNIPTSQKSNFMSMTAAVKLAVNVNRIKESLIQDKRSPPSRMNVGSMVESRYRSKNQWYKAKVMSVNEDYTFNLMFEDGKLESKVPYAHLRLVSETKMGNSAGGKKLEVSSDMLVQSVPVVLQDSVDRIFKVNDPVRVNYKGTGQYFTGTIQARKDDGTYDILYDDGDFETGAPAVNVSDIPPIFDTPYDSTVIYELGDRVNVNYRCLGRIFSGKISAVNSDNTYGLSYDDGEHEKAVASEQIRLIIRASDVLIQEYPAASTNEEFIAQLKDHIAALESENEFIDRKIEELIEKQKHMVPASMVTDLKDKNLNLTSEVTTLKTQISKLTSELEKKSKFPTKHTDQATQKMVDDLNKKIAAKDKSFAELRTKNDELERHVASLRAEVESLQQHS